MLALVYLAVSAANTAQERQGWHEGKQLQGVRGHMVRRIERVLEEKFRALYKRDPVTRKVKETAVQLERELLLESTSRAAYEDGATLRQRIAALLRRQLDREAQAKQEEQRALKHNLFTQQEPQEDPWQQGGSGGGRQDEPPEGPEPLAPRTDASVFAPLY